MRCMKATCTPTSNRKALHIPLKRSWTAKPSYPAQLLGVPLFDSDNDLVVMVRPLDAPESPVAYHQRLACALALARSLRDAHNSHLRKRQKKIHALSNN